MKDKKNTRKLNINKETITLLNQESEEKIKGGATFGCSYPCLCDVTDATFEATCSQC